MATPMPYDPEVGALICERIASEPVSLKRICEAEGMPSMATVFRWLAASEEFSKLYAGAREAQADLLFDETLEIADDSSKDWVERKHFAGDDESPQLNGEAVARSRLRIDTRKWIASKLKPKKYGEKLEVDQKTTLDVADPVKSLLGRIADSGNRLVPSTDISPSEDPSPAGRNEIASDGEK